jgi:hypothetical protein
MVANSLTNNSEPNRSVVLCTCTCTCLSLILDDICPQVHKWLLQATADWSALYLSRGYVSCWQHNAIPNLPSLANELEPLCTLLVHSPVGDCGRHQQSSSTIHFLPPLLQHILSRTVPMTLIQALILLALPFMAFTLLVSIILVL